MLLALCTAGLVSGCGPADLVDAALPDTANLTGPWPATVEGELEIADTQDHGGDDYLAAGGIMTAQGDVPVLPLGSVWEAGGGRVTAKVKPSPEVPDFYEIVEIRSVD